MLGMVHGMMLGCREGHWDAGVGEDSRQESRQGSREGDAGKDGVRGVEAGCREGCWNGDRWHRALQ